MLAMTAVCEGVCGVGVGVEKGVARTCVTRRRGAAAAGGDINTGVVVVVVVVVLGRRPPRQRPRLVAAGAGRGRPKGWRKRPATALEAGGC